MPTIRVETFIAASPSRCFDLARNTAIHEQTTAATQERVVSVVRDGAEVQASLLEMGDEVTFEARHFGVRQRLTSKIVAFDPPLEFIDQMQRGAFRFLRHVHRFEPVDGGTTMIDILEFESPAGIFGSIANQLFLTRYMRIFVAKRGLELKAIAEAGEQA